jgi:hypothetical protein
MGTKGSTEGGWLNSPLGTEAIAGAFANYNKVNASDLEQLKNADFFLFPSLYLGVFMANKNIKKDQEILTWWGQGYYDYWCKKK